MSEFKLLALTPNYDEDNHKVYVDAIEDALKKPDSIKNIALTGGYGVGKSSVLKKVAEAHEKATVQISLSTLGLPDGDGGGENSTTNRIQKEIVKQLLYREEPHRMPGSRFRRIAKFQVKRSFGTALLAGFALSLLFFLAGWATKLEQLFSAAPQGMYFQLLMFIVLSGAALGALAVFHHQVAIMRFKVANVDITLASDETTFFDQFLDEIVYFFDVTKRSIVIFEDIDRFDDPHIFETLRALNTLLNGSKQLKGRSIRFIYAIRDSIFEELGARGVSQLSGEVRLGADGRDRFGDESARANRTKFFDLVIPVVPFITHRNARDLIGRVMVGIEPKISNELIDIAARHLTDMRLIKNVYNEFLVFRQKVLSASNGGLNLSQDELFAMILYKNTRLADFELIKSGKSELDWLYAESRALVRENVDKLTAEAVKERNRLSQVNLANTRSGSLGNKFVAYLDRMGRHLNLAQGVQMQVTLQGKLYVGDAFSKPEFWQAVEDSSDVDALSVAYTQAGGTRNNLLITKSDLSTALGDSLSRREWESSEQNAIRRTLTLIATNREFLLHATFKHLYERSEFVNSSDSSFAQLIDHRFDSDLVKMLVALGFISQDFSLYTSSYYTDRVSARALNFMIHNVDRNVMDIDYQLESEDVEAILRERGEVILRERCTYNVSILDHLLRGRDEKADVLLRSLAVLGGDEKNFFSAYIGSGTQLEMAVERLTAFWTRIFSFLIELQELEEEGKIFHVDVALRNVVEAVDYQVNENFRGFVDQHAANLGVLGDQLTSSTLATVIASLFEKAGVRLQSLGDLGNAMCKAMVVVSCYKITLDNLRVAVDASNVSLDQLRAHNKVVYDYVIHNLSEYLVAINAHEAHAITVTAIESLPDVLGEVVANAKDLISDVLDGVNFSSSKILLELVVEGAWPALADHDAFASTYENVKTYIDTIGGIDEHLGGYLGRMRVIDVGDDLDEDAKEILAQQLIAARDSIPDPEVRVALVESLELGNYLLPSSIASENGPLIGLLLKCEVIGDDAQSFGLATSRDWATMEAAIANSEAFATYMTPALVPGSVVPMLLRSDMVRKEVKDVLVGRFEEFIPTDDVEAFKAVAEYAVAAKKGLSGKQLQRVLAVDVGEDLKLNLQLVSVTGLNLEELISFIQWIGAQLARLIGKGGRRPKIKNTELNYAIVRRLKELGPVSSFKEKGDEIEVNLRKS